MFALGGIFLSYVACFMAAQLEWNPLQPRTPPPKSMRFFMFLSTFWINRGSLCSLPSSFLHALFFFFFFCGLWICFGYYDHFCVDAAI